MFKPGDKVVHTRHGAGTVLERRVRMFEGEEREYFCIKMNDNRYTLLIPVEALDTEELRPAMTDISLIEEVIKAEPAEMDEDYRARQTEIKRILKTRSPHKLAQILRDLAWLEYTHKLTNTDTQLRDKLIKTLAREVALTSDYSVTKAQTIIHDMLEQAMVAHDDVPVTTTTTPTTVS